MEQVWFTFFATAVQDGDVWGYSFKMIWNQETRFYGGVFKGNQIKNPAHAHLACIGKAIEKAKGKLKAQQSDHVERQIKGFTMYMDNKLAVDLLQQWEDRGNIPLSDITEGYGINLNAFLNQAGTKVIKAYHMRGVGEGLKKVATNKIVKYRETIAKGA